MCPVGCSVGTGQQGRTSRAFSRPFHSNAITVDQPSAHASSCSHMYFKRCLMESSVLTLVRGPASFGRAAAYHVHSVVLCYTGQMQHLDASKICDDSAALEWSWANAMGESTWHMPPSCLLSTTSATAVNVCTRLTQHWTVHGLAE
jgi:hypothetical protein